MFQNTNLIYIFGPALMLGTTFLLIMKSRGAKQNLPGLSKAVAYFKLTSIVFGLLLVILWLSLPPTPSLKTFGYPQDVSAIKSDANVLHLFQEYNKAIVRTTEVLQWFLFLFIWWFLVTLYGVAKAYEDGSQKAFTQQAAL
jgi:hypothetical protein